MKKNILGIVLIIVASFSSCVKGPKGDTGNANVKFTEITINPSDWLWDAPSATQYVSFYVPILTTNVIDSGAVTIAIADNSSIPPAYVELPCYVLGNPGRSYNFIYQDLNTLQIQRHLSDNSNTLPSGTILVKITAIGSH